MKNFQSFDDFINESFSKGQSVDFIELRKIAKEKGWYQNKKKIESEFPNLKKSGNLKGSKYKVELNNKDNTYVVLKIDNGKENPLFNSADNRDLIRTVMSWVFNGLKNGNQVLPAAGFDYDEDYISLGGMEKD